MTADIPHFPLITVVVRVDGSAYVYVAGRHVDFPAAPLAATRTAITSYAVDLAQSLARSIRMHTTDPSGTWQMAVHPDGSVTELEDQHPSPLADTSGLAALPATAPVGSVCLPKSISVVSPLPRTQLRSTVATLTFTSGQTTVVHGSALIGRRPTTRLDEAVDQLITVGDMSATASKTHLQLGWQAELLWATDRHSGNGTTCSRASEPAMRLVPGKPHLLLHGDTVRIGDLAFTVSLWRPDEAEGAPR